MIEDEFTEHTDPDYQPSEVEQAAIERALRRLAGWCYGTDVQAAVAASAVRILAAATITQPPPDDPPLFAGLPYPTWDQPSGMFPTVVRPLLNLLEDPS